MRQEQVDVRSTLNSFDQPCGRLSASESESVPKFLTMALMSARVRLEQKECRQLWGRGRRNAQGRRVGRTIAGIYGRVVEEGRAWIGG